MTYWPLWTLGAGTVTSLVVYLSWPWLGKGLHSWCCGYCAARRKYKPLPPLPVGEKTVRDTLGVPRNHPERLTWRRHGSDEVALLALAAELWPGDEYVEIVDEFRRRRHA